MKRLFMGGFEMKWLFILMAISVLAAGTAQAGPIIIPCPKGPALFATPTASSGAMTPNRKNPFTESLSILDQLNRRASDQAEIERNRIADDTIARDKAMRDARICIPKPKP